MAAENAPALEVRVVRARTVTDAFAEYGRKVSPTKEGARAEQLRLQRFVHDFPDLAAIPLDPWKEVRPIVRWLGYRTGHAPVTKNQEVALAFLVALRTAMRAGEVITLRKGSLDLRKRVVTVKHKMQYLTGRPREIPLTRAAARLLRPVADREQCFSVTSALLDTLFRKAKASLNIEGLHFHDSRAEALARLSREVDVMTLAKISGHKDLRLLQEYYYRETPEQIAARL